MIDPRSRTYLVRFFGPTGRMVRVARVRAHEDDEAAAAAKRLRRPTDTLWASERLFRPKPPKGVWV